MLPRLGKEGQEAMDNALRICKLMVLITAVSGLIMIHWISRPLISVLLYGEKTLIIDTWVPWDMTTMSGWVIVYIFESIHLVTAVGAMYFFDTFVVSTFEMIGCQFTLLAIALKNIKFPLEKTVFPDAKESNKLPPVNTHFCIDFHVKLLSVTNEFKKITDLLQTIQFVLVVVDVCLSVLEALSMKGISFAKIINLIERTTSLALVIFMYCYESQMLTEKSAEVGRAAYMNNWYDGTEEEKKNLIMMVELSKKPVVLGLLFDIDLDTFITAMKTAFSYYNFLQAFEI